MANQITGLPVPQEAVAVDELPPTVVAGELERMVARDHLGIARGVRLVVVLSADGSLPAWFLDGSSSVMQDWRWVVVGSPPPVAPARVTYTWTDDPQDWLAAADVILNLDGRTVRV